MAWYLCRTKSKGEGVAQINLERQHYTTYLPVCLADKRTGTKSDIVCLFPAYIFVKLIPGQDDFGPIRSTKGIRALVRFSLWPIEIPDSLIDSLRARENAQGIHSIPKFDYEKNDVVSIRGGVFDGYTAIIHAKKADRITVLLNMINREVKVDMTYRDIQPLTA